jgi:polyribonucleotide nucleotidyltransferase
MSFQHKTYTTQVANKEFHVEIGKFANQANGSVVVTVGQTTVLVTATLGGKKGEEVDFLPLFVDYEEKLYAAGKIKGSRFVKREGRPSEESVLTGRMIDRSIRPFFPKDFTQEVQVIITVLSIDGENDPDFIGMFGASLALSISDIPWNGPLAGVVTSLDTEDRLHLFSGFEARDQAKMDGLFVVDSDERLVMMELGAKEVSEDKVLEAFDQALSPAKELIDFQNQIVAEIGKEKIAVVEKSYEAYREIFEDIKPHLETLLYGDSTTASQLKEKIIQELGEKYPDYANMLPMLIKMKLAEFFKKNILDDDRRPDGRSIEEVRPIHTEVDLLPRTHGTGHFKRGDTQTLTVVTLGGPGEAQIVDEMEEEFTKHFMHHYNFPPFSVGDVRPLRGPGRREIGHGALAEKALQPLIPPKQEFPYTIRLVSEVLGSNGSSSQASICSSSLAMMAAGIPIARHIAGIAIGVVEDEQGNYKLLTDIQGPEDFYGEMDFKVGGTTEGVTAIQMDVKYKGLSRKMFEESLEKAKKARHGIIEKMAEAIPVPRQELSPYAPKISVFTISPEKIGDVIGSGGKTINKIIDETGVKIDIEDDGSVFVTSGDADAVARATEMIKGLAYVPQVGEQFQGVVKRVMNFGLFIELVPGTEGLLHISELSSEEKEHDKIKVKEGQVIPVTIKNIDHLGRVNLKKS